MTVVLVPFNEATIWGRAQRGSRLAVDVVASLLALGVLVC